LNDEPKRLSFKDSWIDIDAVAGENLLSELQNFLKKIETLDPAYHLDYILAVDQYRRALDIIENSPDVAYLNLVTAIETLSKHFDVTELSLADLDERLDELIESIEKDELKEELRAYLTNRLKQYGLATTRFVNFIIDHIEESFWNESKSPDYCKVTPEVLRKLLKRIYSQRSRTLHRGEPFPPYVYDTPIQNCEILHADWMRTGEKQWSEKGFIPHPHFFERLVNHVLKVFLNRHLVDNLSNRQEET